MNIAIVVVAALVVFVYEVGVYQRDKKFKATAVVIATPPAKRWWRKTWESLINIVVVVVLGMLAIALLARVGQADPQTPATPVDDTPTASPDRTPSTPHAPAPRKETRP